MSEPSGKWWLNGWQRKWRRESSQTGTEAKTWIRLNVAEERYQRINQMGKYQDYRVDEKDLIGAAKGAGGKREGAGQK